MTIEEFWCFSCIAFCSTKRYDKEKKKGGGNMAARSANVNVRVIALGEVKDAKAALRETRAKYGFFIQ